MTANAAGTTIIIAEDDDDDFLLTKKALEECGFAGTIQRVRDGEELLEHLTHPSTPANADGKAMIFLLLDLNMPRTDGREALKRIKSDPELRRIPVVVLTTSGAESDVAMAYDYGANSFIRKPAGFNQFVESMRSLVEYWLAVAELPRWQGRSHAYER